MATLYLVATPIGNLEDLSPRAVEILGQADLIAAEDTRHTRKLLSAMNIPAPRLASYYEPNEKTQAVALADELDAGRDVALVSDAGTPGISDPGYRIVCLAIERGHQVVPIPGPNAAVALVSASGLPTDRFLFAGFPPQKDSGRRKFLEDLATERATILLHEAPNRLAELLKDISEIFGEHRRVAIGRELTKIHEEIIRGTAGELASRYSSENPAGEIVLAIEGDREQKPEPTQDILDAEIRRAMQEEGLSLRDASERLSRKYGLPRKRIYRRALELAGQISPETPAEPS